MTNSIHKVKPWQSEWEGLSQEDKDSFYRHNYIHRPENVKRRELEGVTDPMLKVVRNWISDNQDEQAALSEITNKIKERNEQLSKAGGDSAKSR